MNVRNVLILVFVILTLSAGTALAAEVAVVKEGTGDGTVFGEGIECGNDCVETYPDETILHLRVEPRDDSEFLGWLVDNQPQEGALVIRKNTRVTAIFERKIKPIIVEPCGQSPVPPEPEIIPGLRKNLVRAPNGDVVAAAFWKDRKRMLALVSGAIFEIYPYMRFILVSNDTQTIVQIGHPGCAYNFFCPKEEVFFYTPSGEIQKEIVGVYEGVGAAAISDDGYVAVGGGVRDPAIRENGFVTLYDPEGNIVWNQSIGAHNWPSDITISSSAETIAVSYVHQEGEEDTEGTEHLLVFEKNGTVRFAHENIKYFNNFFLSENGQYLVIDALHEFSLRDALSGQLLWVLPKDYTLVGPHAIRVNPERSLLMLVTLNFRDPISFKELKYRWQLRFIDLTNGEEVFFYDFPGLHPGKDGLVIIPQDEQTFSIVTEEEAFCFRFKEAE